MRGWESEELMTDLRRVLVGVAGDLLAGLVLDPAQQDLVAADRVQPHAVVDLVWLEAVPATEGRAVSQRRPRSPARC